MKFKIVELSHSDLQSFFYYALSYFHISWDNENGKLIKESNSIDWEKIVDILVGGGEIKVSDVSAVDEYDFHNVNNLRTSVEILPTYSLSRIKWVSFKSNNILGKILESNVKEVKAPTYHITLQDIYNGINKEEAMQFVKDFFIYGRNLDYGPSNVDTLMQYILFGEVIYT